jgi:aryl-alcohol dehydrogenase-like predicted oxidoreductase
LQICVIMSCSCVCCCAVAAPCARAAGGALSGKYLTANPDPKARFNLFKGYMERYNKSLAREATEEYVKLAQKYNLTPTQLALAWCR